MQFHDDDAVPATSTGRSTQKGGRGQEDARRRGPGGRVRRPAALGRPADIDGGYTANDPADRQYAHRAVQAVRRHRPRGRQQELVLWLAREGTYIRESKDATTARSDRRGLERHPRARPGDPLARGQAERADGPRLHPHDRPRAGDRLQTVDPSRSGGLIETAHALLAGLDPSDEMAFALSHGKLWSVHLNDQNGLKFDQDKAFGAANLRRAFNQVRVLELAGYGRTGGFVGLDVKAMRTTVFEESMYHLAHSKTMFLRLLDVVRGLDAQRVETFRQNRQYEQLEMTEFDPAHLENPI